MLTLEQRLEILEKLGIELQKIQQESGLVWRELKTKCFSQNGWFTENEIRIAIENIINEFLHKSKLEKWISSYHMKENNKKYTIGIVMAGNIPAVGFHDFLCVFVSGQISKIKLSEKDSALLLFILELMKQINPLAVKHWEIAERLSNIDAVIATGSDNSARYFSYYFQKIPHIIRKHRNSVAILSENTSTEEYNKLSDDIFRYYGLGCRSISKLYLNSIDQIIPLLQVLDQKADELLSCSKYKNNFDYNKSLFLLNGVKHWNNDCLLLTQSESLQSRIATLHFDLYQSDQQLAHDLELHADKIQCILSNINIPGIPTLPLGSAQAPSLNDYADHVDTMNFLLSL